MKSKWSVLFLIWLMMVVAYFDRINMPAAATSMMAALHLSKTQWGFALSAFTLGYAIMQAPGGHLADRYGSRAVLLAAIVIWSIFTGLTGLASSWAMLIVIRIVFGFGEGIENGAQFRVVGMYFEPKERAFANSVFLSALALGPAFGTPLATWLVSEWGWSRMFSVFALGGLVVSGVLFALLPRETRDLGSQGSREERSRGSTDLGFWAAVKLPTTWLCAGSYFLFNAAFWGFLSWVPNYLREDRHIPLVKSGLVGSLPYFSGFVGMMIAGYLASSVFAHRRAVVVAVCYSCAAGGLLLALSANSVAACVSGLCVAGFFLYGGFGPFWAVAIDLAPPKARGVFTGSVNCCGQIGAFCSQIIIGKLADQMKSFTGAILFIAGALVCSAVVMLFLQSLFKAQESFMPDNG